MKCKRCAGKATVQLRSHNTAFCKDCFVFFFQRNVERSIEREQMFTRDERILVCVSGGKDSLALWDTLIALGYQTEGLYLGLGIGDYSTASQGKVERVRVRARALRSASCVSRTRTTASRFRTVGVLHPPAAVRRMRHLQAPLLRSRRPGRWLRGRRNRAQPRRRGGAAARQRAALAGALSRQATAGARPRAREVRAQGASALPHQRVRERHLRVPASASTTSSTSARTATAQRSCVYKDLLNRLEQAMPGTKLTFVSDFLRRAQPLFAAAPDAGRTASASAAACRRTATCAATAASWRRSGAAAAQAVAHS